MIWIFLLSTLFWHSFNMTWLEKWQFYVSWITCLIQSISPSVKERKMLIVVHRHWLTQYELKLFPDCRENPDICVPTRDHFPKMGTKVTYEGAALRSCLILGFLGFGTPARRGLLCSSHPTPPDPSWRALRLVQPAMRFLAQNIPPERKKSQ